MGEAKAGSVQSRRDSAAASSRAAPAVTQEVKGAPDPLREVQQFLGNQGILKRLQAKLTVNQPGDMYEQEADLVADAVMARPAGLAAVAVRTMPAVGAVQRSCASCEGGATKCASCEEEEKRVMRKESGVEKVPVAGAAVTRVLNSPGLPLDRNTRSLMEDRFGHAFGNVRVHTGMEAAQSAREISAKAYTVGHDVVFNDGQYKPWNPEGQRLLAHELTHVIQQGEGGGSSGLQPGNHGQAASSPVWGNPQPRRIAVKAASGKRIARDEDKTPWWKKKLNPLYQAALEKLPKEAAEKLEQANAVAKEFVQSTGLSDQAINQAVVVAEPVLKPLEDKFGVKDPVAPPPKKEDKTPVVWLGQPPIGVRLEQRREQKAAQEELNRTDPGALAPPVKKNATQDVPEIELKTPDDPGVTTLPDGQKIVIPPKPPFEVTEDIKFGESTIAAANVQGVRASVVRNLHSELRAIEISAEASESAASRFLNEWPIMRRLADLAGGAEPPSQVIWIDVDEKIGKAHKAIIEGNLQEAAELTKAARKALRNAQATWGRYTDKNLGGAENIKTAAEGTRDAAKYSLIALAVVASGGTALAVATAGGIAIDLADVASRAALGEKVNWTDVTFDIAIQIITAKFGGQLSGKLLRSVLKNPAAQGIESKILTRVIEGLISGAETRTLATGMRGLYYAASAEHKAMTWNEFLEQIADPKSILIDIIIGLARGVKVRTESSQPAPDKAVKDQQPQTGGGKKTQAQPQTFPKIDLTGKPVNDVEPFTGPPKDAAAADDNVIHLDDYRQNDVEQPDALQIAGGQDFSDDRAQASAGKPRGRGARTTRSGSSSSRGGASSRRAITVSSSDLPQGRLPLQPVDPSAPPIIDSLGRPRMQSFISRRQRAPRGPVQGSVSAPFNQEERNLVHGAHGQPSSSGGPDSPVNIFPVPRDINLKAQASIERDLRTMGIMDQEIYVQVYENYEGTQRIPYDIHYRIFRRFEGEWRLLLEKTIMVLH